MAKYSPKQLQKMAITVIEDHNSGGIQSVMLIMTVAQHTNLDPQEVLNRIVHLARG